MNERGFCKQNVRIHPDGAGAVIIMKEAGVKTNRPP